jgi:16S rRNA (guanine(966)-N(2))-methyltransferase RsmD
MRIISGIYKGRRLTSSKDLSIRPTTDRVKEYIFNILQDFPLDKTVLDIFSGSGGLGLEALSRGARHVTFVEKAYSSISVLKQNLNHVRVPQTDYAIIQKDALSFARNIQTGVDLCLMDPPYKYPPLQELIETFMRNKGLNPNGVLVVEHEVINPVQKDNPDYQIFLQKKISRSHISFLQYR